MCKIRIGKLIELSYRQALVISAINNGTAFLAGFVIFAVIGKLSKYRLYTQDSPLP